MFSKFWAWYKPIHDSFHDSEVILWARIQVLVGSLWVVASQTDLAPVISNPKYLTYWLIANGVITEVLRRNRADFNGNAK